MGKKTVLAIIPARGGSKGIPGKNIKQFAGKPLIVHSIETALNCGYVTRTVVSTDDDEIAAVAIAHGAQVIMRPSELAADTSLVIDAIKYTVRKVEEAGEVVDIVTLLEPTSPFRRPEDLDKCLQILIEDEADSVATFTPSDVSPNRLWRVSDEVVEPYIDGAVPWLPRQKQPKAFELTGQIYALSKNILFEKEDAIALLLGRTSAVITPRETALDIDTELDFMIAEKIMEHYQHADGQQ
ncbi:acylneuraminate cytidylyltransferase family protein [Halieaceae bacterium IMCC14734]|uniref:Acylneuraminate cytidylyltransferase family protein n=1 Tax=Candidatus Litorirhabdus singularis TaxID=2518993 RepID=A0ABT3TIG4_9GAMM|nr:acylneuraminate cytidylyltransferase family protein [Candidatus Litorirhabdus singularis]MCX2982122.1 acylneuraminate cytidylyltransferase family protein [Candidatus Litorirhabdus singularis]